MTIHVFGLYMEKSCRRWRCREGLIWVKPEAAWNVLLPSSGGNLCTPAAQCRRQRPVKRCGGGLTDPRRSAGSIGKRADPSAARCALRQAVCLRSAGTCIAGSRFPPPDVTGGDTAPTGESPRRERHVQPMPTHTRLNCGGNSPQILKTGKDAWGAFHSAGCARPETPHPHTARRTPAEKDSGFLFSGVQQRQQILLKIRQNFLTACPERRGGRLCVGLVRDFFR